MHRLAPVLLLSVSSALAAELQLQHEPPTITEGVDVEFRAQPLDRQDVHAIHANLFWRHKGEIKYHFMQMQVSGGTLVAKIPGGEVTSDIEYYLHAFYGVALDHETSFYDEKHPYLLTWKVVIHYFRPDGSYDGWGLHVWESFQKRDEAGDEFAAKEINDRVLKGVTWFKPMAQSGKDDFGVYWLLDAKEFGNGRVNYIIHMGDRKEQCNKVIFWLITDSKELWVNSGDCKSYQTKYQALRARK